MAIFDSNNAFERAAFSKRDPRDERIRAQAEAVKPAALDAAGEVLAVLALLPDAFIRSQKRELSRLMRTEEDEQNPRIAGLRRSIEQVETLGETARHGQARIERLSNMLDNDKHVFQGFVSDAELRPLPGVRVQVGDAEATGGKTLGAVTAADGYFAIPLSGKGNERGAPMTEGLSDVLNRAFAAPGKVDAKNARVKAEAAAAAASQQRIVRVEIFDAAGKSLHEDPQPLPLGAGGIYREYVIGGTMDDDPGKKGTFGSAAPSGPAPTPARTDKKTPVKTAGIAGDSATSANRAPDAGAGGRKASGQKSTGASATRTTSTKKKP